MSRSKNTARNLSDSARKTASLTERRSSPISEHSSVTGTPQAIREWLMQSLEDSHASPSASRESSEGRTTPETCGPKQLRLSELCGPPMSCLRMCREYSHTCRWSLETCEEMAIPFKDQELYHRVLPEPYISESASGYIPTPTAMDGCGSGTDCLRRRGLGHRHGLNLRDWFRTFFNLVYPPVRATEYMMRYPDGWTDLRPLGTDKIHLWLQQHVFSVD